MSIHYENISTKNLILKSHYHIECQSKKFDVCNLDYHLQGKYPQDQFIWHSPWHGCWWPGDRQTVLIFRYKEKFSVNWVRLSYPWDTIFVPALKIRTFSVLSLEIFAFSQFENDSYVKSKQSHVMLIWKWHDDIIKWKHFPHYWPFMREIHWSPVISPHKSQWCGALMGFFIRIWTIDYINNWNTSNLKRHCVTAIDHM